VKGGGPRQREKRPRGKRCKRKRDPLGRETEPRVQILACTVENCAYDMNSIYRTKLKKGNENTMEGEKLIP